MLLKKTDVVQTGLIQLEQVAPDYWNNHGILSQEAWSYASIWKFAFNLQIKQI